MDLDDRPCDQDPGFELFAWPTAQIRGLGRRSVTGKEIWRCENVFFLWADTLYRKLTLFLSRQWVETITTTYEMIT